MSYGTGVKLGKFFNNYMYKDTTHMSAEERHQIREDNALRALYGNDQFKKMTGHERKSRGDWNV